MAATDGELPAVPEVAEEAAAAVQEPPAPAPLAAEPLGLQGAMAMLTQLLQRLTALEAEAAAARQEAAAARQEAAAAQQQLQQLQQQQPQPQQQPPEPGAVLQQQELIAILQGLATLPAQVAAAVAQ